MKTKNMTTLRLKKSIGRSPLRRVLLLILLALACFASSPAVRAVIPPPDGGYPGKNTAEGDNALFSLTSGGNNTALGYQALFKDTVGNDNTATGYAALRLNKTGGANTATGNFALLNNTTGSNNTAIGLSALVTNATGNNNTATGFDALFSSTGDANTADGTDALQNNTTGSGNIAVGSSAGVNVTTGSNNIDIGNAGLGGDADTIRIGTQGTQTATFIAGIYSLPVINSPLPVFVDANGQLGSPSSSRRFKKEIKSMDQTSEAILGLKPVTFQYKSDSKSTPQFGLIAEEVAQVNPDLVVRDKNGEIYTVRYDAVNAMVLNEFLKEHHTVQEQGATIGRLQRQIEALSAGLQKVSAQVEASKPAPQVVNNP